MGNPRRTRSPRLPPSPLGATRGGVSIRAEVIRLIEQELAMVDDIEAALRAVLGPRPDVDVAHLPPDHWAPPRIYPVRQGRKGGSRGGQRETAGCRETALTGVSGATPGYSDGS